MLRYVDLHRWAFQVEDRDQVVARRQTRAEDAWSARMSTVVPGVQGIYSVSPVRTVWIRPKNREIFREKWAEWLELLNFLTYHWHHETMEDTL